MLLQKVSNNLPIGIFDSGVGGLTVMKEIISVLPDENILYLGDTARVPYGTRSPETVNKYALESAQFLLAKGIKILVVACNTASSISLSLLEQHVPIPVIGVVEPGGKAAVMNSSSGKIAVIGTEATIGSGSYTRAIESMNSRATVTGIACPLFVPLIEEGWTSGDVVTLTAEKYLSPLKNNGADTLVLGCTHYPMIRDVIAGVAAIPLIDSAVETAGEVKALLEGSSMERQDAGAPAWEFFVTDSIEKFTHVGEQFLGHTILNISKIMLGG
jgi:glutamate racemase